MAKGRIHIDQAACKGCTLCVTACPPEVITMAKQVLNARGYHPAQLLDPHQHCTGCGLCAVICPEACITVYRTLPMKTSAALAAPSR